MGTRPIFESDFDCLSNSYFEMSLNGTWKQVNSENGLAFGTAIGATKEQLEKKSKTVTALTYKVEGNTVTTTPEGVVTISNTGTIGGDGEYNFMENKIKCAITGKDGDLTLKAVSGWATATAKIVGSQLIESITHHESGSTMTNTWERA